MEKIVYLDGDNQRILKGTITSEDEFFITLKLDTGVYRINKKYIITIRSDNDGQGNTQNISGQ